MQGASTPTHLLGIADSWCRVLYGDQARLFEDELHPHIRHKKKGMLGMASGGKDSNASQFYLTTADALDSLDEKRTLFGEVRLSVISAASSPQTKTFALS